MSNRRHRAFGVQPGTTDTTDPADLEPVTFDVGDVTIRCVDTVDGFQLLLFTGMMGRSIPGVSRSAAITSFISDCIVDEDFVAFTDACKKYQVDIETVSEIAGWLADTYAERPTKSAQPSSAGQTTTGSSSEASSPFVVSPGGSSEPPTF